MPLCGVILAGGQSSRMGTTKSLLRLNNKTVIEHIAETLCTCTDTCIFVANKPWQYTFLGLPIYRDRYVGKGPLAGLETALFHVEADVFVVAACDMPFIHTSIYHCLLQQRADYDAVIPVYNGQIHPLAGIYKKEVLPVIKKMLDADERKVKSLFDHVHVKYVATFPGIPEEVLYKHFFNMNTPAQYEEAKSFLL